MARPVHGRLLLAAVVCFLLLQVSECSRPPPPSPAADHLGNAPHDQLLLLNAEPRTARLPPTSTDQVAGNGRTGADADAAPLPSSASVTPARAVGGAVASSSRPWQTTSDVDDRAGMLRPLRSKLARRFLLAGAGAGAGAGADEPASNTDGASASCNSNNPHINCPPAGKP